MSNKELEKILSTQNSIIRILSAQQKALSDMRDIIEHFLDKEERLLIKKRQTIKKKKISR